MRVALMNPVYWPEVRRGSERFARELADGLLRRGHDVHLVTSHRGRPTTTFEDGLTVHRVWRPPFEDRLRRRLFEEHLAHVPMSYLALRHVRPDVCHPLYATDAQAALRHKRETGTPVVFSFMGVPHRQGLANRRLRAELVVRACREADAVVALSAIAADGFRRWLGVDPIVIHPGVDTTAFAPDDRPRSPHPVILCAADHTQPRKRVGLLVEALRHVRREHPGAELHLSRNRAVPAAAAPGVVEVDLDDRAALAEANRRAHVHALPSVGEAFGLVLAEALACGTPVVGPHAEVVGDDGATGAVFAPTDEDPARLAAALCHAIDLARDPGTRAACRARGESFDADRTAAGYDALYRSLA